jgi:hypothetical protein
VVAVVVSKTIAVGCSLSFQGHSKGVGSRSAEDQCPFPKLLVLYTLFRGVKNFWMRKEPVLGVKKAWFHPQGEFRGSRQGKN